MWYDDLTLAGFTPDRGNAPGLYYYKVSITNIISHLIVLASLLAPGASRAKTVDSQNPTMHGTAGLRGGRKLQLERAPAFTSRGYSLAISSIFQ